jgi:hypothetical protein
MELFNIQNPYYEKWKAGRPSKEALSKRVMYWLTEYGKAPPKPKKSSKGIKTK